MNTQNIALGLQIIYDLLRHAADGQALLGKAVAENRDVTNEELATLVSSDDLAKARLDAEIAARESAQVKDEPTAAKRRR